MTIDRRVAAVEGSLDPFAIVLKLIAEALEYPSLDAYARAIAEVPIEAAPMSRIGIEVEASVRASMKGSPPDALDRAIRRAVGDAIFRYIVFVRLNGSALEVADHEGLRAAAVFYWMGCLLGGPRADGLDANEWTEHQAEQAACWQSWRSVVASLRELVMVEEQAREQLEGRYLGGRDGLFTESHEAWDKFRNQVEGLWAVAAATGVSDGWAPADDPRESFAGRVADRARHLADDARISTFERLGELARAATIVERRLAT